MKITLTLLVSFAIIVLGYVAYTDAQMKKRQELMKIVQDAEHSLDNIQHDPRSHLSSYKRSN
ncbi:hypothetical protein AWW72_01645 [Acinetobacter sp. NRRL B-65365]|uniref:hypothetical protein n=1 Tax=Acinetobacter sp. NRRL B-65365 TaxID=1785092 RepID=UPI00079FDBB5|nr:hypothetical protein [Acinetobacter sp. NRRL B-65365]KYQ83643.1 hypothetical protein AWW72_01645 [Acinetobacter sp. NRRL B-65365]